jgi:5,10-methylenetetrahydromethanopterin reductase
MTGLPSIAIRLHGGLTARTCAEVAAETERCGLAGVWFAENPFARGILPAAAACALATRRIRIAAGVFNPFNRHPTLMAMEIGALDELADGRAAIGIASGIGSTVEKMGFSAAKPAVAIRDAVTIVRGLLAGETVMHEGRAFSSRGAKLDYKPRGGIPILVGGRGDVTVKLAGELADGLIISNMCSPGFTRQASDRLESSRVAAGRTGKLEVVQYLPCAIGRDGAEAKARARRAVGEMVPNYWNLAQKISFARAGLLTGTGIQEEDLASAAARIRGGEDAARVLDDRYTDAFALAGTPEDCVATARRYAEAGVTELAVTVSGPDASAEMAMIGEALKRAS